MKSIINICLTKFVYNKEVVFVYIDTKKKNYDLIICSNFNYVIYYIGISYNQNQICQQNNFIQPIPTRT